MNDRARALAILQKARDILARRLVERILESEEEILDDAQGFSYGGEIDTLHDQLALRLNHVNSLISGLPQGSTEIPGSSTIAESTSLSTFPSGMIMESQQTHAVEQESMGSGRWEEASTMAPVSSSSESYSEPSTASFQSFVQYILSEELDAASKVLAELLDIGEGRARQCTAVFHENLSTKSGFLEKAMELRKELQSGSINSTLMLLWECFGLRGLESIGAMQTLKARMGKSS